VTEPVEFLDLDDLLQLAARLLGDPPPVCDVGLLASAVARPQTTVGGEDAYPTLWAKAGALLQSIVGNHALVDGNKRLAWLATAVYLELNGASVVRATNDEVYELVMEVASSAVELGQITERLENMGRP
jgi:death-on-curing protein